MLSLKIGENIQKFQGKPFGSSASIAGEVVFQTGMVGYPESLTDPSYKGQILVLTYPLIGNYGISNKNHKDDNGIPYFFESDKIQIAGLIVGEYIDEYNHWNGTQSLDQWLKDNNVPALHGIDTRELTKIIRENGSILGKINGNTSLFEKYYNPDDYNLVSEVSCKNVKEYNRCGKHKILVIDCGIKYNQIRMLLKRDVHLIVVPYNYDFISLYEKEGFDKIFISNGPGDPRKCQVTIDNLRNFIKMYPQVGIFGICLGHQLLSLASGGDIYKLKYGNRGHNISCELVGTEYCAITSQNHGFAVDSESLKEGWKELFINANDKSNEGIYHEERNYFSVQFHPEANSGPRDTEYLFDIFLEDRIHNFVREMKESHGKQVIEKKRKILILGSGALSIGQAGEFDYSGSQALKAYKEEGIFTILINPNIATVQTSSNFVDKIYYLPITPEFVKQVIEIEHPDCISVSFGGQTSLNCAVKLYHAGILDNIEILGTPIETVIDTEDRERFKKRLAEVDEYCIPSITVNTIEEALMAAEKVGYPVLVRAAFALGGLGSGFVDNEGELIKLLDRTFSHSQQVIIDKSLRGWKELEYEIVRDKYDNTISVCNMENIDPLGIHTGESIVVAPSQTLTDEEYNMLRSAAIKIIKNLGVVGECNIQYALNPESLEYYVIEINARLSRSSALASKATGYPLAYIAAKLGLGYSLLELKNNITKNTTACFEPSLDYCIVKVPYWDLKKFPMVNKKIGSAMKSIGESMAISRGFEEAFQKALRMTKSVEGFDPNIVVVNDEELKNPSYNRILALSTALYNGDYSIERLYELTKIDKWFLNKFEKIIRMRIYLEDQKDSVLSSELLEAKKLGFSDYQIAQCIKSTEIAVRKMRKNYKISPYTKHIDTVAGEFPCYTNYLYTTYCANDSDVIYDKECNKNSIMILGSGVYKIGSSVEFDWCTVNCIRRIRELGYQAIMVNCNPETVSTDYDEADKLYFEDLSVENIMNIYENEKPRGIILSMGGQIPNNIAMALYRRNVNIIGTAAEMIDNAENRYKFSRTLDHINVDQPLWKELSSLRDAINFCNEVQYPCLVRPSYVLSGAAMNVAYSDKDLKEYLLDAKEVSKDNPVVITKYIMDAKEIEVDAVAINGDVKLYGISEHVENAGVHSGDATLILPAQDLTEETMEKIRVSMCKIAKELTINGPFNIQFIAKDDKIKVIECNLRVSRSFPFVSKTLHINFAKFATDVMISQIDDSIVLTDYKDQLKNIKNIKNYVGVKVPKFSFDRLDGADMVLGVEMMSTGEVACFGKNKYEAYLKALKATGFKVPSLDKENKKLFISIGSYKHKKEFLTSLRTLYDYGFEIFGSKGTADFYNEHNIPVRAIVHEKIDNKTILEYYKSSGLDLIINVSSKVESNSKNINSYGYLMRRLAIDLTIPLITDIKCAKIFTTALSYDLKVDSGIDSQTSYRTIRLPGLIDMHVHVREPGDEHKETWKSCSKSALAGGITTIFAMPNTKPSVVDRDSYNMVEEIAKRDSYCNYGIYLGASNDNFNNVSELREEFNAIGMKMYLNQTYGTLKLDSIKQWIEHVKNWGSNQPICVHAEMQSMAAIMHMCHIYGKKLHICHVSRKAEIDLIRESKKQGYNVTCEVSPHHLFLSQSNSGMDNNLKEVRPILGENEDQKALWENMSYIDCFATDHAPHLKNEKVDTCCPGFPGLETALPLLLTAVNERKITIEDIREKYHDNVCKIFNIPMEDPDETYIEINLDKEWIIPERMRYSKCDWTPFSGIKVKGCVSRTVLNGKTVYVDGEILGKSGDGSLVKPNKKILNVEKVDNKKTLLRIDNSQSNIELKLSNVITTKDFTKDMLRKLFTKASFIKRNMSLPSISQKLDGKIIGSIFYEPSTRTSCSFNAAVQKMGGKIIEVKANNSSVQKGESIEDFIKAMECYCDLNIIRSNRQNDITRLLNICQKPLINAGNGDGEHPTQALLDIYTIREERGTVNGLTITFYGDLKYSRTVHSLVRLLALYNVRINYISPLELKIPSNLKEEMGHIEQNEYYLDEFTNVLKKTDVLYMTRMQKERFSILDENVKNYGLTSQHLTVAKNDLVIMHPLPRVDEIDKEIDDDPRAAYFRQMQNGLYIRMAILDSIFS